MYKANRSTIFIKEVDKMFVGFFLKVFQSLFSGLHESAGVFEGKKKTEEIIKKNDVKMNADILWSLNNKPRI